MSTRPELALFRSPHALLKGPLKKKGVTREGFARGEIELEIFNQLRGKRKTKGWSILSGDLKPWRATLYRS